MGFGIYSSIAGANAREIELEVLSNNIANVQTTGFKELQVAFTSEVDKNLSEGDGRKIYGILREGGSHSNFAPGSIYDTGNPLDVALQGDGLFAIQTADGTRYTRNGNFTVDKRGILVTQNGDTVLSTNGAINVPATGKITIGPNGDVTSGSDSLGRLKVVDISDKEALHREGGNLFSLPDSASVADSTTTGVVQGHLESSNVNLMRNLTQIIEVSRSYEAHQKSLTKQIETAQKLNEIVHFG